MTAYTTIAPGDVDAESPLTTALMTALRDNPIAITEGAAGAPRIKQGALATATASGSITSPTGGSVQTYVLAGGTYSWWTASADVGHTSGLGLGFGGGNSSAGQIRVVLAADPDLTSAFHLDERYIQASPPYDLGDGHVPLFVFALLDKSGEIKGTWVAADPPWANHGPTCIRPDYSIDGVGYQLRRKPSHCIKDLCGDPKAIRAHIEALADMPLLEVEVTTAFKNSDMAIIPHPFASAPEGSTIVLLDPVHDFCHQLAELSEIEHARTVRDLLLDGYIKIDNTALDRASPPGVMVVRGRLK